MLEAGNGFYGDLINGKLFMVIRKTQARVIGYGIPDRVVEAMKQQLNEHFRDFGVERYAFVTVGHADGKSDN